MFRVVLGIFVLFASLWSTSARADFIVCNEGTQRTMSVAWAFQRRVVLIAGPYDVGGWKHIAPNSCEVMGRGDIAGASVWVRAVSQGTVLTRGERPAFSKVHDSDQKFCVANEDFDYNNADVGAVRDCPPGQYLAEFPVTIWQTDGVDDLKLSMNPDAFSPGQTAGAPGPRLPDLHGALAVSARGIYYADHFEDNADTARREVLSYCAQQEGRSDAGCQVRATFKNQCIAVAAGTSGKGYTVYGQADWEREQTLSQAMTACRRDEGDSCKEKIAVCSTRTALAQKRQKDNEESRQRVANALGVLFGGLASSPSPPPSSAPPSSAPPSSKPTPAPAQKPLESMVQICMPMRMSTRGSAVIDAGSADPHLAAVSREIDAMKADRHSPLNNPRQTHVQVVVPDYRSASTHPQTRAIFDRQLPACPANHREQQFVLAQWLRQPGLVPQGLAPR